MKFILIEALTFGLGKLVEAAEKYNVELILLTSDKSYYTYELENLTSSNITVTEINTFDTTCIINHIKSLSKVEGIINLTDTWAEVSIEICEALGLKPINKKSIHICRNKNLLRKKLIENKLTNGHVIEFNPLDNLKDNIDNINYPVIIKDTNGTGSRNVWLANNINEFKDVIDNARNLKVVPKSIISESYFKGTLYSVETLSYKGETKVIAISSRIMSDNPDFKEVAISLPLNGESRELEGVDSWIKTVLKSISYEDGFAHTEFIITQDGYEVVEVNPRLGGVRIGNSLCDALNQNIYEAFIEISLGKRPQLLDKTIIVKKHLAQVFIYAKQKGEFIEINSDLCNSEVSTIYPTAFKGKSIETLSDQSSCVGMLVSEGSSSEIALLNALSESNRVKVTIN